MAVYTEVNDEDLAGFVAQYDIGGVLACKGIAEGVENTNYILRTEKGAYILTLYEKRVNRTDLPFFMELMEHLSKSGVTCPTPIHRRDGKVLGELAGRPAAIISFLEGVWIKRPNVEHCGAVGRALAAMHNATITFPMSRPNALSLAGWQTLASQADGRADSVLQGLAATIAEEIAFHERHWPQGLPNGVIHADLFPDNVFFLKGRLSGLIDFYFACTDILAYDVAICLNAWCFEPDHAYNATKGRALLAGYRAVRPLSDAEMNAMPVLARGSALRFMLTRLVDWLNVPAGALVKPKDPLEYWKKLRFHQRVTSPAEYGFDL